MLLALLVYLPHIQNGGWYVDDWLHVALMGEAGGLWGAIDAMNGESYRPGLAISLSVFHAIGGERQETYLAIGALLAGLQGWLFYLVLRRMRLKVAIAATCAATFVVLPVIDATRLWMSAYPIQVSGALFMAGLLAALHGIEGTTHRRRILWHAVAVALFLAAMLTYELVAGLIVCCAVLYWARAGWRAALRRWPADLGAVALALAFIAPRGASDRDAELSIGFLWDRARQTAGEADAVFGWLLPWQGVFGGPVGVILLMIGLLGVGVAIGRRGPDGRGLATWAWIAVIGVVFSLAGLVMLLPADPYFVPRTSGLGNRTGAFAAFGTVVLLTAVIVLALGGLGVLLRRPRAGYAAAVAVVAVTALNLTLRELRQQDPWAEAWTQQKEVLAAVDDAFDGPPPRGSAVVTLGQEAFVSPADVSVFAYSWDLRGAIWLVYDRPDAVAHPWRDGSCGSAGVIFPDETSTDTGAEPYGYADTFLVDTIAHRAFRVRGRRACEAATRAILE